MPFKIIRRLPALETRYPFYDFTNRPHTTLAKAQSLIPKDIFDSSLKFAVVRDPVQWLHSVYRHWQRYFQATGLGKVPSTVHSFEDFIRFRMDQYPPLQSYQFAALDGTILIDKLGNFSNLGEFAKQLEFDLSVEIPLANLNRDNRAASSFRVSEREESLVADACKLDFKIINFDGAAENLTWNESRTLRAELAENFKLAGGAVYDPWVFRKNGSTKLFPARFDLSRAET